MFKAKAYLDLNAKRMSGANVDSRDIRKHKNDILRILTEFMLERVSELPGTVHNDIREFVEKLGEEPFDSNLLKSYGVTSEELEELLRETYNVEP